MKKKVFALLLASLLVVSQMGVALSETEVISTPTPTLQAIIGALMGEVSEPTAEVTKAPTDENGDDEEEESTDVKDDEETGDEEEKSTEENGNDKSGNEEEESTEENGNEDEQPADDVEDSQYEVSIWIENLQDVYYVGDTIRICSQITGVCPNPTYQWQVLHADDPEQEWEDIAGETNATFEFIVNEKTFTDSYRVIVTSNAETIEE